MKADLIDEHYYRRPEWFFQHANRYDNYPRNGSKIFAGEWAAQSDKTVSVDNKNNWLCALSEAVFMTGLERNADVVNMASYAPLFAHAEGWQWPPDLIWVDNLRVYGTPNYYGQKLYSLNKGTNVLNLSQSADAKGIQPVVGQYILYASAAWNKATNEVILKLVNVSTKAQDRSIQLDGVRKVNPTGRLTLLKDDKFDAVNSFENATAISPVERSVTVDARRKTLSLSLPQRSFTIVRIKVNQ